MHTERVAKESERDPLAGTAYRTVEKLDAGGMGVVLEAVHRRLGKRVCVKVLRRSSPEFVDRMQLEAHSLAALDGHPNVVLATDFGETPAGQPFLVMERLYGRTLLEERSARGPLPPLEAIDLACQALAGLEAVHALGVVHRDIKPGNLFLCNARNGGKRTLKILDFGAAKVVEHEDQPMSALAPRTMETAEGTVIGSPRYMAPEQIGGTGRIDPRADLYALGCVLFGMLTGRGPFDDRKDHLGIVFAHLQDVPPAPSILAPFPLPAALDRAVLRALAKKPEDRFPDAATFAAELLGIASAMRAPEPLPKVESSEPPDHTATPTMISPLFAARVDPDRHAKRWMVWATVVGLLLGVVVGVYVLGVFR